VAFVLAVSITNTSTQGSLEAFFAQASGRAHLTLSNMAGPGAQSGLRASLLREAQAFPGVAAAAAMTSDIAILLGKDNTDVRLTIAGIDPTADRARALCRAGLRAVFSRARAARSRSC
jgi:hypothetical protein